MGIARKIVVFGVLALVLAAVPASAQSTPPVGFSAGYNYMYLSGDDGEDGESVPVGWYAEVSGNVAPMVSLVGHVTGNYKSFDDDDFDSDVDFSLHTFTGGVRFTGVGAQANPFAHVLFGGVRSTFSSDVAGADVSESTTDPVMFLGGGVNLMPGAAVGLRLGADYIRGFGDSSGNAFRFVVGINFGR